jgi:hypothetical protein
MERMDLCAGWLKIIRKMEGFVKGILSALANIIINTANAGG